MFTGSVDFFKSLKSDISVWFGFLLVSFISIPMVFQPGFVVFTDFVHGPHFQYDWRVTQVAIVQKFLFQLRLPLFTCLLDILLSL